jgi:hypothetical protein
VSEQPVVRTRTGGATKTNRDGRACPSWCTRDHQADDTGPWGCTGTERGTRRVGAEARLPYLEKTPEVAAWLFGPGDLADLAVAYADAPYRAADLAKFIEHAADARKEDLRALAANIRDAAAEAWPEQEAEAGR